MPREIEDMYGCFRCGTLKPMVDIHPDSGKLHCGDCGEISVVSFKQALDMLNSYYVTYKDECVSSMYQDEYYLNLDEEEE